jgi:ribosomal protein L11 methyltransferase
VQLAVPLAELGRIETLLASHGVDACEEQNGDTMSQGIDGMDDGHLGMVVYTEGRESALALAEATAAAAQGAVVQASPFDDTLWAERWKEFIPASVMAGRVVVRPPFRKSPRPELPEVVIDPGLAFGTGSHETTRLACKLALDAIGDATGDDLPSIADVGCGTGVVATVLARVAGAHVDACDIDPEAIRVAREVLAKNGLGGHIRVRQGSAADALEGRYGLVVANILSETLVSIAPDLIARCEPGGVLILSGILRCDEDTFMSAFRARGDLELEKVEHDGEWVAFGLRANGC